MALTTPVLVAAGIVPTGDEVNVWISGDNLVEDLLLEDNDVELDGDEKALIEAMLARVETNENLSLVERKSLKEVLEKFRGVFGLHLRERGILGMKAKVKARPDAIPVRISYEFHNPELKRLLEHQDEDYLRRGLIEKVYSSAWYSAQFGVKKKPGPNGEMRVRGVVDLVEVDKQLESMGTDKVDIKKLLASLSGAKFFAVFDLTLAFEQVELEEASRVFFVYMGPLGLRKPYRLPQGHKNSPALLNRILEFVFAGCNNMIRYVDDIVIYGKTCEEFLKNLETFFAECAEYNVILKPSTQIGVSEIKFLGMRISGKSYEKIQQPKWGPMRDSPPKTLGDLLKLLGIWNWMAHQVPRMALLLRPLRDFITMVQVTNAAGKHVSLSAAIGSKILLDNLGWTPKHTAHVARIWDAVDKSIALALPDPERALCVMSDASELGCAYIMLQCSHEDMEKPLAERQFEILNVWSKSWQGPERNWTVGEWELFPVHHAVTQNVYLALGRRYNCYVDHQNLIPLIRNPHTLMRKQSVSRVARMLMMFPPGVHVEYIPGVTNVWADYLSRQFQFQEDLEPALDAVEEMPVAAGVLDHFVNEEGRFKMPSLELIAAHMGAGPASLEAAEMGAVQQENGVWEVNGRIWVPPPLRPSCIVAAHCSLGGHRGLVGTLAHLTQYIWPGLELDVANEIKSCLACRRADPPIVQRPWGRVPHGRKAGEVWSVDWAAMPDNLYLCLWRDSLSQYAFGTIHKSITAGDSVASLQQLMAATGCCPREVESDGGSHFLGDFASYLDNLQTKQQIHHARNPQANGSIENLIGQLKNTLLKLLAERGLPSVKWPTLLHMAIFAMNNAPSALLLGHAPVEVFTGRPRVDFSVIATATDSVEMDEKPLTVGDLEDLVRSIREQLIALEESVADHKDQRRRLRHLNREKKKGVENIDFEEGDLVLVSAEGSVEGFGDKLTARWVGPFEVVEVVNPQTVKVRQSGSDRTKVVHTQRVRMFAGPEVLDEHEQDLVHAADLSLRGRFMAEKIVGVVREGPSDFKFKVRWAGYGEEDDTLEPLLRFHADVPHMVEQYLSRHDLPDDIKAWIPDMRKAFNRRLTRAQARAPRRRYTRF